MKKLFDCPNFLLNDNKPLGALLIQEGVASFYEALEMVENYTYARISDLENYSLVCTEKKGTCSSKHAFLAALALENGCPEIYLEVGYFKLMPHKVPHFADHMTQLNLSYILEAHCYLKFKDNLIDVTSKRFDIRHILDLNCPLEVLTLKPNQAGDYKQKLHLEKFKKWCYDLNLPFEESWKLRWDVIKHLVNLDAK